MRASKLDWPHVRHERRLSLHIECLAPQMPGRLKRDSCLPHTPSRRQTFGLPDALQHQNRSIDFYLCQCSFPYLVLSIPPPPQDDEAQRPSKQQLSLWLDRRSTQSSWSGRYIRELGEDLWSSLRDPSHPRFQASCSGRPKGCSSCAREWHNILSSSRAC